MAEAKQSGLLSRADIHELVRALTAEMQTAGFNERLREAVANGPVVTNDMEFIVIVESLQREFIARQYNEKHSDGNNNNNNNNNKSEKTVDGEAILKELQQAVLRFPDKETETLIRNMCMVQESQMLALCTSAPELSELVKQKQLQQQQYLQQQQQQHGHSHQHGPNCQHGHSHGMPNPQQMMEMQMAVQSLSPQLREDMVRIQQRMQSGQQPTAEEAGKMREIQNHIMAFMTTMRQFSNNPVLNKAEGNAAKK
ncbi:hypothetical protein LSM04_005100 [Trypanosoma melophagium]|uniref:uncharacterized protein n=1 Tax=Trypanosoma melophagium TaxID=715481 RepID=UPI00351A50BE|nr:hypothetical protein LSM04_005100 [Trypanosoma melophagium]